MASLKKRGNIYYAQYYAGGKRHRKSLRTDSWNVARAKLRKLEDNLDQGSDNPLPSQTPVAEVLEAFARHVRAHKKAKNAQNEIYRLRRIFGPVSPALADTRRDPQRTARRPAGKKTRRGKVRGKAKRGRAQDVKLKNAYFEQIAPSDISWFLQENVRRRGWSGKTANDYRQLLVRLFNWAMAEGGVRMPGDRNPAAKVRRYREQHSEISFLTLEQVDRQLEALADRLQMQVMVALYIYAGLRREEAMWLQADDVDLDAGRNGMIRVRAKTVEGQFWEPKTKSNRAVPISSDLRRYLENYKPRPSTGRWYFPSPEGCHWDPDNFSDDLREANRAAGMSWTCLDYRHTFGSRLAQNGVSLYKISTLMGNSPEICRRHYAALVPEAMSDVVEFTPGQDTAEPDPPPPAAGQADEADPPVLRLHRSDGTTEDLPHTAAG